MSGWLMLVVVSVLYFITKFLIGFVFELLIDISDRLNGENGE